MDQEIKKIVIPVAGLGTRFLPLSLVVSKEFFPLADKPVIHYIIEEAKKSGITEVIFVISPKQKMILDYFKKSPDLEKILIKRNVDLAVLRLPVPSDRTLLRTRWRPGGSARAVRHRD